MAYTTTTTSITSATSSRSKQATAYQYPSGNGVAITGSGVNSNTSAYLDVTTPGAARSYTAVSGGGATITQIVYLDTDNVPTNANAVSTTGGNIKIVGTGFASGAQVYVNNALVSNTFANSTAIIAYLNSASVSNVSCYIFNSSNSGGAISANSVRFSGAPSWVSSAAVSSYNGVASNIALQASGDGTLTYSLKSGSGSLPTNITLVSSGYLSGTATGYTVDTVVTFTLIVTDSEGQATQQAFSYTVFIGDTYFKQTSLLLSATVSNTFISDSSVNNFLITRNGDTRPSRLSPYWPGGWSGYFDGTGQNYITVSTGAGVAFGTGDYTVECYGYATSWPSTWRIISFPTAAVCNLNGDSSSGLLKIDTGSGGVSTNITLSLNRWFHLAVVRQSGTLKVYIDGLQGYSVSNSTNYTTSQSVHIGGYPGFTQTWDGYLSNFRIVKGTALYTANFTPSTSSLTTVSNVSMLTLRDSILADYSPYNSSITRGGTAKLTTFSPFNTAPHTITANTNSVYFDGTGDFLNGPNSTDFAFSGDFTVECWIYPTTVATANVGIYSSIDSSADNWAGVLLKLATSTLTAVTYTAIGDQEFSITHQTAVTANAWHHIALTRSGTTLRLFLDGVLGTTTQTSSTSYGQSGITIGAYYATSTLFTGYISNLRVQKGTAQYTANFTPSTSSLTTTANTKLLACQASTIIDSNTTAKTLTINGNPNVSIANPFGETVTTISNYTWTANSYGASAYFDGATGTRLTLASNTAFSFGTGAYTVEAWVFLTSYPSTSTFVIDCGANTNSFGLAILASGALIINQYGVGAVLTTTSTLPLNSWNHVAISRSSTSSNDTRLYINGKYGIIGTDSTNWTVTTTPSIGGINSAGYSFPGYISDVRVTKGTALYTTSFVPPTAPLANVANVSLLTLQSDIGSNSAQFLDQSPNNFLITRNGNASQGTFGPLVPSTWSAYFDGTGDYISTSHADLFALSGQTFTIEAWVYPTAYSPSYGGGYASAICGSKNADGTNGFEFTIGGNASAYSTFGFNTKVASSFALLLSWSYNFSLNTWYHIALVKNGNNYTAYVNGAAISTQTNSATWTNLSVLTIGSIAVTNYEYYFPGYISNFRLIKGTAQYSANFTPSTTTISPVANTSILTLRGPILVDDSGYNNLLTRNGDTKIVPFGPFSPQIITPDSYSYKFSNASDYISTVNSNLALGQNNWTVESWVYPRFTANSGIFQISNVQYGLTNSNLNTIALGFSSSNKAIVRVANATYTSTGTTITANAWTHLALVKSSNVSKLYINGTLDSTIGTSGSITDTVNYTGTTNIAIGGYGSTSALANAYISNFRVVSNSAVYTENFTPAVGPLTSVSGTTLLTCQANTVIDSSTANLTMTANANVTPSIFNPFDETVTVGQTYTALTSGGGAYFDGTTDSVSVPASSEFAYGTGKFTVEGWIYPMSSGDQMIYAQSVSGTNYFIFNINANVIKFAFATSGAGTVITSSISAPLNSWSHIAIVREGTGTNQTKIYVNGLLGVSSTCAQDFTNTTYNPTIGAYSHGGNAYTGYVSNFRVLKGTALYTANFVPPAGPALPTTANTSLLLNFTNSGVIDSTGRNILESVADAKVTTNLKKYGTGSYYFDGTGDYMYVMGNSTELAFGTGDFTIEFWINPADATATFTMFDCRPSNTNGVYPMLYTQSSSVKLYVSSADRITGGALSTNNWTHVALARSGSSTKLFLNGTQSGSTYTDTNNYLNGANRPILGINGYDLLIPMTGYLTDLRVTKGYARYTANFTVPSEPFILK